jgi:hypothetical protein
MIFVVSADHRQGGGISVVRVSVVEVRFRIEAAEYSMAFSGGIPS